MVYTTDEIQRRITPIAQKYQLQAVYLFGSYARNEATDESDVDFLVDTTNSVVKSLLQMGALYEDFIECLGKNADVITTATLEQKDTIQENPWFIDNIAKEKVIIYERPGSSDSIAYQAIM